jgi:hypothetical protein
MSVRRCLVLPLAGIVFCLAGAASARADQAALVKKIESLNGAAAAAYDAGDNQRAKTLLLEAVVLSKENGLGAHPAVARSYLQLGLVHVEGFRDEDKGIRYFSLALRIVPEIKINPNQATAAATRVFDKARGQARGERVREAENTAAQEKAEAEAEARDQAPAAAPAPAQQAQAQPAAEEKPAAEDPPQVETPEKPRPLTRAQKRALARQERLAREAEAKAARLAKLEEAKAARLAKLEAAKAAKAAKEEERLALLAAKQQQKEKNDLDQVLNDVAKAREREGQEKLVNARQEIESLKAELAQEREAKLRLQKDKATLEQQLSETKTREQREREAKEQVMEGNERLQKNKLDSEKQLARQLQDSERGLQRKIADAELRERKEREAREKAEKEKAELQQRLEGEKAELQRQLAEAVGREKQERQEREKTAKEKEASEKDKAKQLAEVAEREKKEREAREKLESERRLAEAKAAEQKQLQEKEKQQREKLAEGPDLPSSIPQPMYCNPQDEAQLGMDIYVHCVPQGQVKAAGAMLFYRPSGSINFNSLAMERNRKGWYVAAIPAEKVAGRTMQFFVQARGKEGEPVASNGKPTAPNVIMLRKKVTKMEGELTSASSGR